MAAMLRLPDGRRVRFELPEDPGLCETCRERPSTAGRYCDRLCAAFDHAIAAHAEALAEADGDPTAPAAVFTRTQLRAIAAVYDGRKLRTGAADRLMVGAQQAWAADVAAGLLLPVGYGDAIREVHARFG